MFGLSLGHLLIVLVVVLLFQAKNLPGLGSALGRGIRGFKKGLEGEPLDDSSQSSDSKKDPTQKK